MGEDSNKKKDLITELGINLSKPEDVYAKMLKYVAESAGSNQKTAKVKVLNLIRKRKLQDHFADTPIFQFLNEDAGILKVAPGGSDADVTDKAIVDLSVVALCSLVRKDLRGIEVPVAGVVTLNTGTVISEAYGDISKFDIQTTSFKTIDSSDKSKDIFTILKGVDNIIKGHPWNAEESEKSEKDLFEETVRATYGINGKVSVIMNTYTYLFAGGYDVIPNVGILKSVGGNKYSILMEREVTRKVTTENGQQEISGGFVLSDKSKDNSEDNSDQLLSFVGQKLVTVNLASEVGGTSVRGKECTVRTAEEIVNELLANVSSRRPLSFPNKLVEYTFGYQPISKKEFEGVFRKSSQSVSWEGYSEIIKADLIDILTSFLTQYLIKFEGVDTVEKVRAQRSFKEERLSINLSDVVTEILDYAANCLTNICVVKKYEKISGKKTGSVTTDQKRGLVTNFQFMSCMPFGRDFMSAYSGESSRDAFIEDILNHCYGGSKGDMEGTESLGSKTPDLSSTELKIYEVGYQYNKKLANGRPQFAYKALNSLIRRGKEPTVENTILGSSPSGETITLNTKGIDLKKNPVHFIFAGSRSGKGVMTMNIIASQIYSKRAIFYLDRKPDMAVTFNELSGKKPRGQGMFVINGSSNDRALDEEQIFVNDFRALEQNHPNIPDYAIKALLGKKDEETLDDAEISDFFNPGKNGILPDIIYYKALLLVSGFFIAMWSDTTCTSAQKKAAFPEFYDGVTLIADEIRLFQEQGFSKLEKLFSDTLPPYNGLDAEISKIRSTMEDNASIGPDSKKKPKKLETGDLKQKFNITRMYIEGLFNVLGESVHYSEGLVSASFSLPETSNVFLIGQNCEQVPMSYEYFNGDNMRRLTGNGGMNKGSLVGWESPIFSLLHPAIHHRSGGFDAIIGFNSEYPQYLDQENPKSQAFGRLDDVARNFAYVPNFNTRMDSVRLQQKDSNRLVFKRTASSSNLEIANSKDVVYFKPFLILNDCTPTYLTNKNCVLDQCKNMGIAQEEIISDNPFCDSVPTARGGVYTFSGDRSGLGIDNRVGFKDYLFSMGLQAQEIEEALTISGILMNRLVQEGFGYEGTWWDFLTDLRWEYQFTVRDICNAVKNVGTKPQWKTSSSVTNAFKGFTKVQEVLKEINGSIQSNEEAQYMAEAEGTTITSYSAEQSMQLYDEVFGGYESSGGDLLSGNKPLISSTKLRVNQDEDQIVGQPSTGSFVGSGSIGSGFTNGQGQDVFISSSEDSDGLDISGLSQRSQSDRPSDIPVGSRFPTYAQPKEQPQQPTFGSQSIGQPTQNTQEFGRVSQPTKTVQTVEVPDDLRQKLGLLGMDPDTMSFENLTSFANITGATPPKMVERQISQPEPVQGQSWNTGSVEDDLFEGDPDLGFSSEESIPQAQESMPEASNPVWNQGLDDFEVNLYDSEVPNSTQEAPAGQAASWVDPNDSVPTQDIETWSGQQGPVKPAAYIIPSNVQAAYSSSSPKQTEEDAQKQRELDTEVDEFKEQQKQHFVSLYETAPTPEGKEAIAKAAELMGITLGAPEPEVKVSVMQDGYYDSAYTDSVYIVPDDYLVTPEESSSQEAQKMSEDCQAFAEGYTPEDELKGYSKQENYTYTRDQNRPTYNAEELHAAYLQNIDSVVQYITNSVLEFGGGANSITKFVQRAETIHVTSGVGTQPKMFNYKLPPSLYTKMSPEMVAVLDSACVSEMFDYSALRLMKNLTLMRFSADVLQNNVLPCLGLATLDIEYFFANWKKLDVFRISMFDGQKETFLTIRRDNMQIAMSSPELKKAFFQNDLEYRIGYAAYQNARNKKVLSLEKWKKYKERREQGGFFNTIEGIAGQAIHGTGAAIHEASSITTGAVSGFSLFGKKVGNLGQKVSQGLRNAQGTYRATEAQRKKLMERLEREKNRQS